jgi:hypothetical protein
VAISDAFVAINAAAGVSPVWPISSRNECSGYRNGMLNVR